MPNGDKEEGTVDVGGIELSLESFEQLRRTMQGERARVMAVLTSALTLLDHLLTEMRVAGITPSAGIIVHKAEFDRQMRELLGQQ